MFKSKNKKKVYTYVNPVLLCRSGCNGLYIAKACYLNAKTLVLRHFLIFAQNIDCGYTLETSQ